MSQIDLDAPIGRCECGNKLVLGRDIFTCAACTERRTKLWEQGTDLFM